MIYYIENNNTTHYPCSVFALLSGNRCITRSVCFLMLLEAVALDKTLFANVTLIRPLSAMCALMDNQRAAIGKGSIASFADERPVTYKGNSVHLIPTKSKIEITRMDANVFSIMTGQPKGLITNRADVFFNGAVGQKVLSEATVMSELFIACSAFVRFNTSVNSLMFFQIPLKKG